MNGPRRLPLAGESMLAFLAALASFTIGAVVLDAADATVLVVLVGAAFIAAVTAVARLWGVAYAVPIVIAGLLAYDWFQLPPTHPLEIPDSANLVDLFVLIGVAVLVGEVAAHASRRAEVFDAARSELAEEQAALRHVATLVARERPPAEILAAVAEEVAWLLAVEATKIVRYEEDGHATVVARFGHADALDACSSVASPILVEGRVWGTILAVSPAAEPLPAGTDLRIAEFTELVATAISNIQARTDLAASRARIVAAADEERRRVVRDLHDGAQQRLVHTVITLSLAEQAIRNGDTSASALVTEALANARQATSELRELAHGILPSALTRGGLQAGVDVLASRTPVPVETDVSVGRLPAAIEATAYFVVAEALTNVAKHAHARHARVSARVEGRTLRVDVRDDGVGGARLNGSGLVGLRDRLAAVDGELRVESPANDGTLVAAAIPLPEQG